MKFELNRTYWNEDGYSLKISRTELLKQHAADAAACLETLNYAVEMFCSPNCFVHQISGAALEKIVSGFKTTYKALEFLIDEDDEGNPKLVIVYTN